MYDEEWRKESMCRGRKSDFWYPPMDADVPEQYYSIAREVCRRCPVWTTCLNDGKKEVWGMWGGLTPQERSVLDNPTPKPNAIKPHGSWIRYRQGCTCSLCTEHHNDTLQSVNMNSIPYVNEPVGDLDAIRFGLLS